MKLKTFALVLGSLAVVGGIAIAATETRWIPAKAPQVEDADAVKADIADSFRKHPEAFVLAKASGRLANSRLEGFEVCSTSEEATAEQYIEVSAMIDKAKTHAAYFRTVVDGAMDAPKGMSDCDFRVISVIARVVAHG